MSLGSTLKHVLGFVAGILISGARVDITNLTHAVQQVIATAYGEAAKKLAAELKLDTTGMTGEQKVFAIVERLVATGVSQDFKGDLRAVCLDVAQATYRASEPEISSSIAALAAALHAGPALTEVAEVAPLLVQEAVDAALPKPALVA